MLRHFISLTILLLPFLGISQTPWINEIHYDNVGGDVNECVEIAGAAGTDLTGYSIVLYNGGNLQVYDTDALSGLIPDEGCGYGTVSLCYPSNGLQNGAPDGIAIVDGGGVVIQFLSYEGTLTASNGPASGMTSTDIGVNETNTTPTGTSMQLTGSGSTYGAFTWSTGATASQGSLNTGQSITPCGAANTITTGTVSGGPYTVDCTNSATDAGSVAFVSTGTFGAGNIYSVELSDASGSFASPTVIGTLASAANSGSINFTIPAATPSGTNYLVRIVSDNPIVTGTLSTTQLVIVQLEPCIVTTPAGTGLIINEWSNGSSGNQEYYEFVVAGQCGTTVDIRGYILDDNNGTFTTPSAYSGTSSGIAPGHFRFSYVAQWASIPVGSLIVIYNNGDPNSSLPADDPTDSNLDSLYVIPHDNALFERCVTLPAPTSPDSTYTPCTYAASPTNGWGVLSLRNGGDAIQIRNQDGSYYHGVSYGGSEISGGPHNLKQFNGNGSGMCGWFSDGDFFDVSNWSSGSVAGNETPGVANNSANAAWLSQMRNPNAANCPIVVLPVELIDFDGKKMEGANLLHWQTQSENNSTYFTLERSMDVQNWEIISIEPAAGNSQSLITYSFDDRGFKNGVVNYYRLSQTDVDGSTEVFGKIVSIDNREEHRELVKIVNLLGQEINESARGVQIHIFSDGTSEKMLKY